MFTSLAFLIRSFASWTAATSLLIICAKEQMFYEVCILRKMGSKNLGERTGVGKIPNAKEGLKDVYLQDFFFFFLGQKLISRWVGKISIHNVFI